MEYTSAAQVCDPPLADIAQLAQYNMRFRKWPFLILCLSRSLKSIPCTFLRY